MNQMQVSRNPFPGLRPFEVSEQHLFFGREGQSKELLKSLTRTHFLTVVGTSGSGKSSLVRAGLLPLIYGGYMTEAGASWRIAVFRPGDNPIRNLALALNNLKLFEISKDAEEEQAPPTSDSDLFDQDVQSGLIEAILRRSALGLLDFVRESAIQDEENLLIVVDQFEELFRFKNEAQNNESGDEAAAFVKLLLEATREKTSRIYVVLTMRSDFLGDCAQFRDLPETINKGQYLIPRMTRDQQREAICFPPAIFGIDLEPPLLHRLLNDVGDNPDQLPLLQHALMRTWNYWVNNRTDTINLTQYKKIGGMEHALSLHADEAYLQLAHSKRSQDIAERLFKCLTEKGPDSREVRRPAKLREICAIVEATEKEVISVINVFRQTGRSFLMPPDIELDADSVIDISHESLIRGWKQLKAWVKEEAESAAMYRRLAHDAVLHEQGEVYYWRDPALELALKWRAKYKPNRDWGQRYHPDFDLAMAFLDESEAERDRQREKEEEQQREEEQRRARELEAAQKLAESESRRAANQAEAARRLRWMVAALAFMFLVATGTAVYALFARSRAIKAQGEAILERQKAEEEKATAEEQKRIAEGQTRIAQEQTKIAKRARELASGSEEKAQWEASNAKKATLRAEAETRRANHQAKVARKNLQDAENANTKDQTNREGLIALERGEAQTALNHFQLLRPRYAGDPPGEWWVLHNLGTTSRLLGDYPSADKYYQQALAVLDPLGDEVINHRIATRKRLAQTHYAQGHYNEAIESYKQLLALLSQTTAEPLQMATIQSDLADVYFEQGNNAEAQPLYEGTVNVFRESLKAERELIATKRKLAQVYSRQANKDNADSLLGNAETQLKEVIDILEKTLQPDHISIAESYNDLALLYQQWGKQELAAAHYKLAQDIREKNSRLDRSEKSEADELEKLQADYIGIQKYAQAEALHKRELPIREKLLKPEDPNFATQLEQMASFYVSQQRYSEAEPFYKRALEIRDNALRGLPNGRPRQDQQVKLIANLRATGSVYFELRNHSTAKQLIERAIENQESLYGKDNIAVTRELALLGQWYLRQRKFADAEPIYRRLVTLWRKDTGPGSRQLNIEPNRRVAIYMLDPERPLFRSAVSDRLDPSKYIDAITALATIYGEQRRYTDAESLYIESLTTLEWLAGLIVDGGFLTKYAGPSASSNPGTLSKQYYAALAETLENYAALLRKTGSNREAEASALELRAKEARNKELTAYKNLDNR